VGRSHLTAIARRFRTQRACYVAATTQAGPADEDSAHRSHVAARHDPKRALVQSFVSDAGPPNRLFSFRARSRVRDFSKFSHTRTCSARIGPNRDIQARACNTLAFRAVARWATHRHRARRPAPWPRAHTGACTATLPGRLGRGAGKQVPPPPPQRRRPAGVAQRPRAGPSPRRAAHLRATGGAADTAHVRAGGVDRRATGRL